jgi:CelD/BcsL family acetyltransferase involved in cellulose biosynthesis
MSSFSALRVEKIETRRQLLALENEWCQLEAASRHRLPFTTFDWAVSWWDHLAEQRLTVSDRLYVRALRSQTGELVGVAPLMITERPARGPARVRILQFFGADPYVTELRGMVCAAGTEGACHRALHQHLHLCADEWDWMQWGGLPIEGEGRAALCASPGMQWEKVTPMFLLPLPASWDEFRAGLKRNIKESLRKCYNSLARDGHPFTFRVVEQPNQVAEAVNQFLQLHRARSALDNTVRHGDVFSSPATRRFLIDVCERLAQRGQLRVFVLEIAGRPVAIRLGFALGDTLYLYFSGFDPDWAKYSVMTTTVAEAIKYAIDHQFKQVNLSTGNDVSKTRWGPTEVLFQEGLQISSTRRAELVRATYHYLRSVGENPAVRRAAVRLLGRRA